MSAQNTKNSPKTASSAPTYKAVPYKHTLYNLEAASTGLHLQHLDRTPIKNFSGIYLLHQYYIAQSISKNKPRLVSNTHFNRGEK